MTGLFLSLSDFLYLINLYLEMEEKETAWLNETEDLFRENLKGIHEKDIRFYRLEEFWRNIQRLDKFSNDCPVCKKMHSEVRETIAGMNYAVMHPGKKRRRFDRALSTLASHMTEEHGFLPPYYFTYRWSALGMPAGALVGALIDLVLFHGHKWGFIVGGTIIGLLIGYVLGGRKDNDMRARKKLL